MSVTLLLIPGHEFSLSLLHSAKPKRQEENTLHRTSLDDSELQAVFYFM